MSEELRELQHRISPAEEMDAARLEVALNFRPTGPLDTITSVDGGLLALGNDCLLAPPTLGIDEIDEARTARDVFELRWERLHLYVLIYNGY
jgi:hypothetical protein